MMKAVSAWMLVLVLNVTAQGRKAQAKFHLPPYVGSFV